MSALHAILHDLGQDADSCAFVLKVFSHAYGESSGLLPSGVKDEESLRELVLRSLVLSARAHTKDPYEIACLLVVFADTSQDELMCLRLQDFRALLLTVPPQHGHGHDHDHLQNHPNASIEGRGHERAQQQPHQHHYHDGHSHHLIARAAAVHAFGTYVRRQCARSAMRHTELSSSSSRGDDDDDDDGNDDGAHALSVRALLDRVHDVCTANESDKSGMSPSPPPLILGHGHGHGHGPATEQQLREEVEGNAALTSSSSSSSPVDHDQPLYSQYIRALLREIHNSEHQAFPSRHHMGKVGVEVAAAAAAGGGEQSGIDEVLPMFESLARQQVSSRRMPYLLSDTLLSVKDEYVSSVGSGHASASTAHSPPSDAKGGVGNSDAQGDMNLSLSLPSLRIEAIDIMLSRLRTKLQDVLSVHDEALREIETGIASNENILRKEYLDSRRLQEEPFRKHIEDSLRDCILDVGARCKDIRAKYIPIYTQARTELIKHYDAGRAAVYGDEVFERRFREEEGYSLNKAMSAPKDISASDRVRLSMENGIGNVTAMLMTQRVGEVLRSRALNSANADSKSKAKKGRGEQKKGKEGREEKEEEDEEEDAFPPALPWPIVVEESLQGLHFAMDDEENDKYVQRFQEVSKGISLHAASRLDKVFLTQSQLQAAESSAMLKRGPDLVPFSPPSLGSAGGGIGAKGRNEDEDYGDYDEEEGEEEEEEY